MMMSFCKKSVHSFLYFSNSKDNGTVPPVEFSSTATAVPSGLSRNNIIPSPSSVAGGLTFLSTLSENKQKPFNIVESSTLKIPPKVASSTATAGGSDTQNKRDPGGIGFLDDVGGSVDGLMSCTESLGFESSDERRVDDDDNKVKCSGKNISLVKMKMMRKIEMRKERKSFPPPLSSLTENGKPNFFLQPVRKDGRLELTEVKIHRPEILRASRCDGRLRLNFICEEEEDGVNIQDCDLQEEIERSIVEVKEDKERGDGWRLPPAVAVSGGGGDALRGCHELAGSRYHNDNLNEWRSNCVTIK